MLLALGEKDSPGTSEATSSRDEILRSARTPPDTAVIERPTLLRFSSRLLAVTTISSGFSVFNPSLTTFNALLWANAEQGIMEIAENNTPLMGKTLFKLPLL